MNATGQWSWWRDGDTTVVGWIPADQFTSDEPICTVKDARDAGLLVDVLTDIEAEPIRMSSTLDTLTIRFGGMNTYLSAAAVADLVEELRPDSEVRARLIRQVENNPHMFHRWQREAILRAAEPTA